MQEKTFINNQLGIKFNSFIDRKCRVWFKAKEVAQILGYKNTEKSVKRHVSENHKRTFLFSCPRDSHGQQKDKKSCQCETHGQVKKSCPPETGCQVQGRWIIFIDEAGFYELVFKSRLPSAKMFREWVFTKVLPSIRKYGYYRMIDCKRKQRIIFNGKKYYKHPVFSNYAANKNGDILSLKSEKILKMIKDSVGYLFFNICDKKWKNQKPTYNIDLYTRFLKDQYQDFLKSTISTRLNQIIELKIYNYLLINKIFKKVKIDQLFLLILKMEKKEDLFLLKQLQLN